MTGTKIITKKTSKILLKILLSADNTFGAIGSGGYEVKQEKTLRDDTIIVFFKECDCAPATTFPAFIKDGSIYGNKIAKDIMGILSVNHISFSTKPNTALPSAVISFLKKKLK